MTDKIRELVSKNKRRLHKDGYNLDLSYITDQIIAMGYPADKLEGVYRNHIDDVVRFFEHYHKDHYKVYNLCDNRAYNVEKFHGRVGCYPFEDHHPPDLRLLKPFCEDVHAWLTQHPDNVVAIHCKAGKGRTGVMICAYLLYRGEFLLPQKALEYYGTKRTMDMNGVTIPSQKRYVEYFGRLLNTNATYRQVSVRLKSISFQNFPSPDKIHSLCPCYFVVYSGREKVYKSRVFNAPIDVKGGLSMDLHIPVYLLEDVRIDFYHKPSRLQKREKLFHFWFNTFFLCPEMGNCASKYVPPDNANTSNFTRAHNSSLPNKMFNGTTGHSRYTSGDRSASSSSSETPSSESNTHFHYQHAHENSVPNHISWSASKTSKASTGMGKTPKRCNSGPSCPSTSVYPQNVSGAPNPSLAFSAPNVHVVSLHKEELDRACKDKKLFPKEFKVDVEVECVGGVAPAHRMSNGLTSSLSATAEHILDPSASTSFPPPTIHPDPHSDVPLPSTSPLSFRHRLLNHTRKLDVALSAKRKGSSPLDNRVYGNDLDASSSVPAYMRARGSSPGAIGSPRNVHWSESEEEEEEEEESEDEVYTQDSSPRPSGVGASPHRSSLSSLLPRLGRHPDASPSFPSPNNSSLSRSAHNLELTFRDTDTDFQESHLEGGQDILPPGCAAGSASTGHSSDSGRRESIDTTAKSTKSSPARKSAGRSSLGECFSITLSSPNKSHRSPKTSLLGYATRRGSTPT